MPDTDVPNIASPLNRLTGSAQRTQIWRSPRRRKLFGLGFLALVLASLLFFKESASLTDILQEWESAALPIISPSATVTSSPPSPPIATGNATVLDSVVEKAEPVVFVLIMWSEASAREGALLIKSILLYSSSPSEFHIICDDSAERFLEARLALVIRPRYHVRAHFYKPSWQSMLDRVEREGSIKTDHSAGLPGLMKLFIHEIIPPTVKKGIYVDTDAMFISDPTLLWVVFNRLQPSTAIVMSSHPDQDTPEWHHASRICSCIMLLDLEKLRALRMMDSSIYRNDKTGGHPPALSPPAFQAMYGSPEDNGRYDNVRLGDQGYWWAIVDHHPEIFEPLSYDFEITSCLMDTYLTGLGDESVTEPEELSRQTHTENTPQEGTIILPKLLHFNCLHGTPVYMDWSGWSDPTHGLTQRWGAAVAYHVGVKWIWLNQGDKRNPDATLETASFSPVIFADEAFAVTLSRTMRDSGVESSP